MPYVVVDILKSGYPAGEIARRELRSVPASVRERDGWRLPGMTLVITRRLAVLIGPHTRMKVGGRTVPLLRAVDSRRGTG
jgi:hypothetical protein